MNSADSHCPNSHVDTTSRAGPSGVRRDVREWAATSGYEVSSRGRIPAEIQEAFDAAHGPSSPLTEPSLARPECRSLTGTR
ncbi:Lsr2 family protein [Rhodococcus oxybenzonivorans]|uniref:Lsr2 family protein n=1 Tax=Rhodococcus oxybenzonivorans TaxID=1990687 RepID=UPI00214F8DBF|nr:Lsr2 family protein [Rhodococcus oxybenzonivorans]